MFGLPLNIPVFDDISLVSDEDRKSFRKQLINDIPRLSGSTFKVHG